MQPRPLHALTAAALLSAVTLAQAQVFSGRLDDPGNTALVSSDLSAASFIDDAAMANNVALYTMTMAVAGVVSVTSTGFAGGGVDPYFSIFSGAGTSGAFVDSNYLQAFGSGGDFTFSTTLPAGTYRIALGSFANMSFAENLGSGTLADGFTGLGGALYLGDSSYRLVIGTPVPEPAAWLLLALGLPLLLQARLRRN